MRTLIDTLSGVFWLAVLFARSGFRSRGGYWTWRWHTAFGKGAPPKRELIRSGLEFCRWMGRMRGMG